MRVVILYNAVAPDASAADRDVLAQAAAVEAALRALGHEAGVLTCTLDLAAAREHLLARRPQVVVNLVESLGGSDRLMCLAPALLEAMGVPFTGSKAAAVLMTTDKLLAKRLMADAGIPTPPWLASGGRGARDFQPGRYILKPVSEDASFGLDDASVVDAVDADTLTRLLDRRSAELGCPCFAERFIDGREFNLSLLAGPDGPQVLPPAEIEFAGYPAGKPRIVGRQAKWDEAAFEYHATPRRFDFPPADGPLVERLTGLARDCWDVFGLSGYARVDFRVDGAGRPWVLEANANPCLSPDAGFAAAIERAGMTFDEAVRRLLAAATAHT